MIQTLIPAYRPTINAQPLSSASIASREANSVVVEPAVVTAVNEQAERKPSPATDTPSPTYEDPRKSTLANEQSAEDKKRELIEQMDIQQLSARDREVRAHERAHAAVGGQYASAPTYQYERGPDGINYAVAGEVSISTGAVAGNPQATIEKAQVIRRAALAPAEPSPQDRQVAAEATKMELDARAQLSLLQQQTRQEQLESIKEQSAAADEGVGDKPQTSTIEATQTTVSTSNNDDDRASLENLSEIRSANDRITESFGQKIMSINTLQDPPTGLLIDEIA